VILEGIVTTINEDGTTNISPMGPIVEPDMTRFRLRPYRTSTTYANLKRTGHGVLHVTDDVLLLARAAIGFVEPEPPLLDSAGEQCRVLADACRWYAFRVTTLDDDQERTDIAVEVTDSERLRDFFGLNRAKHAIVEAAILATRVAFLPAQQIAEEMGRLAVLVEKTGGPAEHEALELLQAYIRDATPAEPTR
jgi:hypothetical protein